MKRGPIGYYVPLPPAAGEWPCVPNPLPPSPPLDLGAEIHEPVEKAEAVA